MDPLKELKEALGLPTEGHEPLIEPTKIEVNRDLIRAFHEHTLERKEARVVANLVATYRAWFDAELEVLHELAGLPPPEQENSASEQASHDDSDERPRR